MPGRSRTFEGIGASPGVAIGRVFLLDRRRVRVPRYHIEPDQAEYEVVHINAEFAGAASDHDPVIARFTFP